MKKLFLIALAVMMVFAMTACGSKEPIVTIAPAPEVSEAPQATEEPDVPAAPQESEKPDEAPPHPEEMTGTLGQTLKAAFRAEVEGGVTAPEEVANALAANRAIEFSPVVMPVEAGWLAGFDAEIQGFSSAATFAPMIGSIPFVGYVFELEEGADVNAFIDTLTKNANPRWNVCVEADETVVDSVGSTVFFLMCP